MKILTIPASYGLCRPVSGGLAVFLRRVGMHKEKGWMVSVLQSESYRDEGDGQIADVAYFREIHVGRRSLVVFRDSNPFFVSQLQRAIERTSPDVLEFNHPSGMLAGRVILSLVRNRRALVYQAQNVESDFIRDVFGANPTYSRAERIFLRSYVAILEAFVCKFIADHITTVTAKDRDRLIHRYRLPQAKVTAIGHGFRVPAQIEHETREGLRAEFGLHSEDVAVVFVGASMHFPNVEAANTIESFVAPEVWKLDKRIVFIIAGAGFSQHTRENVRCLGYVQTLEKLLSCMDIAIAPIQRGAGVKLKVLDYMAAGLPLVATNKAIEGIEAEDGKDAIILERIDRGFVDAIIDLAHDRERRRQLGMNAREVASSRHGWERVSGELDVLYRSLASRQNGTATS